MENKAGYKTTEFWMTALFSLLTLLNQSGLIGHPLPVESIATIAAPVLTYTFSRGQVKGNKMSLRNLESLAANVAVAAVSKPVDPAKLNQ